MANLSKTLPSGASLEASMGSFEECENLLTAVAEEAEAINIKIGEGFQGIQSFFEGSVSSDVVNTLKNVFCGLLRSKKVKDALRPCIGRALYNGQKITAETFEPEEARQDYLPAMREILFFSLAPFFKNQSFTSLGITRTATNTQK